MAIDPDVAVLFDGLNARVDMLESPFLTVDAHAAISHGGDGSPLVDVSNQYVTEEGDNSNDGFSWESAVASVAAAVDGLPIISGATGQDRHAGVINVGPGTFTEPGGLELNTTIKYRGQGSGGPGTGGTTIRLADNSNDHLFRPTSTWTGSAHHVLFESLCLDGNKTNQSVPLDLVQVKKAGFNCVFRGVFFP